MPPAELSHVLFVKETVHESKPNSPFIPSLSLSSFCRALVNVQASMGITPSAATTEDVEMADDGTPQDVLPPEVSKKIGDTSDILSAGRKQRKFPDNYASAEDVKAFTPKHTIPSLHSASPAGINALAVSTVNPSQFLTGGNDKFVQLYDRATDKVLATLKGHTKKVNHVAFRENANDPTLILSGGADKIAKVWSHDTTSNEYVPKSTIRIHKGDITGLAVHPTSTLLVLSSADKTYSIHDLNSSSQIFQSAASDEVFSALSVHPDGTLLGLGTTSGTVQIYDVRSGVPAASFAPEDGASFNVSSLCFSENGYHLMVPDSPCSIGIWDLRKRKLAQSIPLGEDFKIAQVLYDTSARYLAVAGSVGGRIFAHKTWQELLRMEEGGQMSSIAFGQDGKEIWGTTGRDVRIWGLPA
jgi:pre-mRNA-processing factor 19